MPVALLSLALHFYLVADRGGEFRRLLPVAMAGITVDVVLTLTGVFDFDTATIVPLWLIVLWWVFAAAIYRSFAKIGQSLWLAAALGGIAVPFNYMVGAGLGAVSLPLGSGGLCRCAGGRVDLLITPAVPHQSSYGACIMRSMSALACALLSLLATSVTSSDVMPQADNAHCDGEREGCLIWRRWQ